MPPDLHPCVSSLHMVLVVALHPGWLFKFVGCLRVCNGVCCGPLQVCAYLHAMDG